MGKKDGMCGEGGRWGGRKEYARKTTVLKLARKKAPNTYRIDQTQSRQIIPRNVKQQRVVYFRVRNKRSAQNDSKVVCKKKEGVW